jgi:hypothetical protein
VANRNMSASPARVACDGWAWTRSIFTNQHRVDPARPIEETVGAMAQLALPDEGRAPSSFNLGSTQSYLEKLGRRW